MTNQPRQLRTSAMIASFADEGQRTTAGTVRTRPGRAAAQTDERIVGLTADLGKYTDMHIFAQAFPARFFQMGMAEQLLFGAAAGMAETGLVPFASTYSVFAARRAYDFICLDIAEPGAQCQHRRRPARAHHRIRAVGHQATEDVAIFRGIPGLTIVDPCDSVDITQAVPQLAASPGTDLPAPAARPGAHRARRIRLHLSTGQGQGAARRGRRGADLQRTDDHAGPAGRHRTGQAPRRRRRRAHPEHSNPSTPKPSSPRSTRTGWWSPARTTPSVGGLFETVAASAVRAGLSRKIVPVALPDEFLAAGALPTLHEHYGLSKSRLVGTILEHLG